MRDYYVEVYQPDGKKAEAWKTFPKFEDAINWLDKQKKDDPKRILRIRGELTVEQQQRLMSYGIAEDV
jgi:hypothetical protein